MSEPRRPQGSYERSGAGNHVSEPREATEKGDLELIRWALSLQPEERLAVLQDFVDTFWTPRHG